MIETSNHVTVQVAKNIHSDVNSTVQFLVSRINKKKMLTKAYLNDSIDISFRSVNKQVKMKYIIEKLTKWPM